MTLVMLRSAAASQQSSAMSDWLARSTAPGVIWAHLFTQASHVNDFVIHDDADSHEDVRWEPNDGIMGNGCIDINTPAGETQEGSWGRPLQPLPGDINLPGLSVGPAITNTDSAYTNWNTGYFGHSSYHAGSPGKFVGTDYYFQYRAKFHPNRFQSIEPSGKMVMFVTGNTTPNQEIVVQALTDYGGGYFRMYTNKGSAWNSFLTGPQGANTGDSIQPGGPYQSTCVIGEAQLGQGFNNCWVWPTNEWVTCLIHVIPGRNRVVTTLGHASNPKEFGIEVWVARAGATSYTKIWEYLTYEWEYDSNFVDQSPQPFGINWMNLTSFTGGSPPIPPSVNGYWHRHDQLIFSTQFIACPQPA